MYPFRPKSPNKKRTEARRVRDRLKLYGAKKSARRHEIFVRSGGRCEVVLNENSVLNLVGMEEVRCPNEITEDSMHWSHNRHGIHKDDSAQHGIASCERCHKFKHNGGKPVPRRPGRIMSKSEARKYLRGKLCVCGAAKKQDAAFCESCNSSISAQSRMNLEELHNNEWLAAFSDAEKELLSVALNIECETIKTP